MTGNVQVSGTVCIRPVRLGIFFDENEENFRKACSVASGCWGGAMHLLISQSTPIEQATRLADLHSLDAIVPLDTRDEKHPLALLPGLTWHGLARNGPLFEPSNSRDLIYSEKILDVQWILGSHSTPHAYDYDARDPLRNLLLATYGGFYNKDESAPPPGLQNSYYQYKPKLSEQINTNIPGPSALDITCVNVDLLEDDEPHYIVMLDHYNIEHLMHFWNMRATGGKVFPWPHSNGTRKTKALTSWFSKHSNHLEQEDPGEHDAIEIFDLVERGPDPLLVETLKSANLRGIFAGNVGTEKYQHLGLAETPFRRDFTLYNPNRYGEFSARLPRLSDARHGIKSNGVVAVDVKLYTDENLPAGATFNIPNVRRLSSLLLETSEGSEFYRRPIGEGVSIGTSIRSNEVSFAAFNSIELVRSLLHDSKWRVSQSESGIFAAHVIKKLGGESSTLANQPAYRAALQCASNSPRGAPLPRLIAEAKNRRGMWSSNDIDEAKYPEHVVYSLLRLGILRPYLAIKCPQCANELTIRPPDLDFDFNCEFCGTNTALGLALGLHRQAEWVYRLAGSITPSKLAETLPIMASLNVLHQFSESSFYDSTDATIVGMKIEAEGLKCEIDVATFVTDALNPVLVIGEVKSYRDSLTQQDVANLRRVQRKFRSLGIRCVIMLCTLRSKLEGDELQEIRAAFADVPTVRNLSTRVYPDLPLVLVSDDLSSARFSDEHPARRLTGNMTFLEDHALDSCKRNLGLLELTSTDEGLKPTWTDC
ncbi:hypothetical protein ACXIZN_31705 [Amycolatopsis sp. TRM77291]